MNIKKNNKKIQKKKIKNVIKSINQLQKYFILMILIVILRQVKKIC